MSKLFGTDGIRGIANKELTTELVMKIGKAVAKILIEDSKNKPLVVIGMDTRISSEMLCNALVAGICSGGTDVKVLGVVPTPAVAYLIEKYKADAGIMISASHNSAEYNGIKIFDRDGYKLADELEEKIENIISLDNENKIYENLISGEDIGSITYACYSHKYYIEHLKNTISNSLNGLKIAVDTANGAASIIAKTLFTELGAEVHMLSDKPNGININENCGSTHLEILKNFVIQNNLDLGIAFDGDADRCLCVDELGNEVDGDQIMAICALDMIQSKKLEKNTVVGTILTNGGIVECLKNNGISFVATKVGDRYILEEMLREKYNFGGEQSGHIIFKDFATTGDGELTAIQLLSLIKRKGKKLSELTKITKKYPQVSHNINVTNQRKADFYSNRSIHKKIEELQTELGKTGRIIVRPSGTEPKIRIMVEGEDEQKIKNTLNTLINIIEKELCTFEDAP